MDKVTAVGYQDFSEIIEENIFYIDKTKFIKEWWDSKDKVTLITRPRRFGKTLTMSMLEYFWSVQYKDKGYLFENLEIWEEGKYRELQGTYPVIGLSFANIKATNFEMMSYLVCQIIQEKYLENYYLLKSDVLTDEEKQYFKKIAGEMSEKDVPMALNKLSNYLSRYYGKKVLIFLDEYDTPMQEAYVSGYWEEIVNLFRELFNSTFETNPYLERAIMTGITRVSKESIFSDLNNLKVVTTTSNKYADDFGFTESEVFATMDEMGFTESDKEDVKYWYDGFTFGNVKDIYNPWSIINYFDEHKLKSYWANTSSNGLVGKLLREGKRDIKVMFEELLRGNTITCKIDEEIVFSQLETNDDAVWSLLLASGYMRVTGVDNNCYMLELTNYEIKETFENMIADWFAADSGNYNDFLRSLLQGDIEEMNDYMNSMARSLFSFFDTGKNPSVSEPERFYHGFVLGLLVELKGKYVITSNRESGFGRYDIMLEPIKENEENNKIKNNAIIIEFKVFNGRKEKTLEDTLESALAQIEEKKYEQTLLDKGFEKSRIRKYGFTFRGKEVLIRE